MLAWTYDGVNLSIPGTGGPQCVQFSSVAQRICEAVVAVGVFSCLACWSRLRLSPPPSIPRSSAVNLRKTFLCLHCIVFGMELGFKLASKSLIWILNPCHMLTIMQILLLVSEPSDVTNSVFRLHLHMMNGPLLALAFPVLNTRLLPFECVVYFMQHVLILLFPIILMDQNSNFSVEPLDDPFWTILSLSLQVLYHFVVLLPIALVTGINLNSILCPAVSDPFSGPFYRLLGLIHQSFLILVFGKCITCFGLTWNGQPWPWRTPTTLPSVDEPAMKVQLTNSDALVSPWLTSDTNRGNISLASSSWCWTDPFNFRTNLLRKSPRSTCTVSRRAITSSTLSTESTLNTS